MPGIDSFTKIMLHFNGSDAGTTFTDSSASAHTFTGAGNAQLDTAIKKFGTAALLCDGTGDYVSAPDSSDFTLASNDWTIDFWFNVAGGSRTNRRAFGQFDGVNNSSVSVVGRLTTSNVWLVTIITNTIGIGSILGTTAFTTSGWHHFALVRTGNTIKLFLDGVQDGSDLSFTLPVNDSAEAFFIGNNRALTTEAWNGSIDEFRLSNGIARWTTAFTPPSSEYATDQTITGTLFTNTQSFPSAMLSWTQTITAALFTNSQSFFGSATTYVRAISAALFTNTNTFYGASTLPVEAIFATLFTNTQEFFASYLERAPGPPGPITDLYRRTSARKRAFWEAVAASRFRSRY